MSTQFPQLGQLNIFYNWKKSIIASAKVGINSWWTTQWLSPVLLMETSLLPTCWARCSCDFFARRSAVATFYLFIIWYVRNIAVLASDSEAVGWFANSKHFLIYSMMWSSAWLATVVGLVRATFFTMTFYLGTFLGFWLGVLFSPSVMQVRMLDHSRSCCRLIRCIADLREKSVINIQYWVFYFKAQAYFLIKVQNCSGEEINCYDFVVEFGN